MSGVVVVCGVFESGSVVTLVALEDERVGRAEGSPVVGQAVVDESGNVGFDGLEIDALHIAWGYVNGVPTEIRARSTDKDSPTIVAQPPAQLQESKTGTQQESAPDPPPEPPVEDLPVGVPEGVALPEYPRDEQNSPGSAPEESSTPEAAPPPGDDSGQGTASAPESAGDDGTPIPPAPETSAPDDSITSEPATDGTEQAAGSTDAAAETPPAADSPPSEPPVDPLPAEPSPEPLAPGTLFKQTGTDAVDPAVWEENPRVRAQDLSPLYEHVGPVTAAELPAAGFEVYDGETIPVEDAQASPEPEVPPEAPAPEGETKVNGAEGTATVETLPDGASIESTLPVPDAPPPAEPEAPVAPAEPVDPAGEAPAAPSETAVATPSGEPDTAAQTPSGEAEAPPADPAPETAPDAPDASASDETGASAPAEQPATDTAPADPPPDQPAQG